MNKKSRNARTILLDVAGQLFSKHGFSAVTTRMISDHAGVAPGNLYYYFKTKEAIFREVFWQMFDLEHALDYKKLLEKEPRVLDTADGQAYAIQRIVSDYFSRTVFYKEPWKRELIGKELFSRFPVMNLLDKDNPFQIEAELRMELFFLINPDGAPSEAHFWSNIPDTQGFFYLMSWPSIEKNYDANYIQEFQQRVINTTTMMMIKLLDLPIPEMLR